MPESLCASIVSKGSQRCQQQSFNILTLLTTHSFRHMQIHSAHAKSSFADQFTLTLWSILQTASRRPVSISINCVKKRLIKNVFLCTSTTATWESWWMFLLFGAVHALDHVIYTIRIYHLNDLKVQLRYNYKLLIMTYSAACTVHILSISLLFRYKQALTLHFTVTHWALHCSAFPVCFSRVQM